MVRGVQADDLADGSAFCLDHIVGTITAFLSRPP
jgi:hypothetical protein